MPKEERERHSLPRMCAAKAPCHRPARTRPPCLPRAQSNPMVRQLSEQNPQLAAALNDPATIQEMIRVMQNPVGAPHFLPLFLAPFVKEQGKKAGKF